MKQRLKGMLAVFLAIALMTGMAPPTAQASDGSGSGETIVFSDNFETGYNIGDEPRSVLGDKEADNWSRIIKTATAGLRIDQEALGNKFMLYYNDNTSSSAGPRTEKMLDLTDLSELSIHYRIKTFNQQSNLAISGGGSLLKLNNGTVTVAGTVVEATYYAKDSWTEVSLRLNLAEDTFSVVMDGLTVAEDAALAMPAGDRSSVVFQFGSNIGSGKKMHLDDVIVTARETEQHVLFNDFFDSGYMPGDLPRSQSGSVDALNWSLVVKSETATVTVAQDPEHPENQYALYNNAHSTSYAGPRLEKKLAAWGIDRMDIIYRVKTGGERHELVLMQGSELHTNLLRLQGATVQMAGTPVPGISFSYSQWADVRISLDFAQSSYTVAINGSIVQEDVPLTGGAADPSNITLRFNSYLGPGKQMMLDGVQITTPDTVGDAPDYLDTINVNVEHPVVPALRQQHPRLMVTDFGQYRSKINQDPIVREWYESVKKLADHYLEMPVYPYEVQTRNHILPLSRNILHEVYTLAFVYQIEGATAYRDRLWLELENAAGFPSWHPNSFLSTAEMTHAFAIAYDWLYYDFTSAQREILLEAMLKKGIEPAARIYNGESISEVNFVTSESNWNLVCNSSEMIAAIAIADEEPGLAEFLLDRAGKAIHAGLAEYTAEGSYPEGAMYWTYGTNYLTYGMAALESAFPDPALLPAQLRLSLTPGLPETGQFPVYLGSGSRRFNYGDSMIDNEGTPILYWHANTYGKPEYTGYQLRYDLEPADEPWDLGSWDKVFSILWYEGNIPLPEDMPLDKSYAHEDSLNAVLLRSSWRDPDFIYAGLQGGYNSGNHMFLSIGNFVLDALGERWATMRGQGTYSMPGYFDMANRRWTYYNTRAEGQNTLVINPDGGPDQNLLAVGRTVAFGASEQEAFGIMDMTEAYEEHVTSAKRGIRLFDNRSKIMIQDEITAEEPISSGWWFMHTPADVAIQENGKAAMLTIGEKRMWASIAAGPEDAVFTVMDAKPLPQSPNPSAQTLNFGQKLAIRFSGEANVKLSVVFVPLMPYEAAPDEVFSIADLSEWSTADTGGQAAGEYSSVALERTVGDAVAIMAGSPFVYSHNDITRIDAGNPLAAPVLQEGQWFAPASLFTEYLGAPTGLGEGNAMVPVAATAAALGLYTLEPDDGVLLLAKRSITVEEQEGPALAAAIAGLLERQLLVNGQPVGWFDRTRSEYELYLPAGQTEPDMELALYEDGAEAQTFLDPEHPHLRRISVLRQGVPPEEYVFRFTEDPWPLRSESMLVSLKLGDAASGFPSNPETPTWIPVKGISASLRNLNGNGEENTLDNDLATRWSTEGEHWLVYDLGSPEQIHSMALAIYNGSVRITYFDLEKSQDGVNWTPVATPGRTSGSGDWPDIFELGDITARYIKINVHGNNQNKWNSFTEVKFYRDEAQEEEDSSLWNVYYAAPVPILYPQDSQVQLELLGFNRVFGRVGLEDAAIEFSSDNEQVAVVSNEGLVTLKTGGTATITCRVEGGHAIRTATVTLQVEQGNPLNGSGE